MVGFGRDAIGRLYVVHSGGDIFRVKQRAECNDGLDNDGDGRTDFPDDPGCIVSTAVRENPDCDDGLDGDGLVDFGSDPGCAFAAGPTEEPPCNDGRDNDGDGAVDLLDPECRGNPAGREAPLACGSGVELSPIAAGAWVWGIALRRRRSHRR